MTEAPTDAAREAAGLARREDRPVSQVSRDQADRIKWVESALPRFVAALQDDPKMGKAFMMDAITAVRTTPDLAKCTEVSFLGGLMQAASLRLRPNVGALGHCWLIPFENKRRREFEAQFVLGARGMITVAGRSGITTRVETIYENDEFDVQFGLDERLHHRPPRDNRGRPILELGRRGAPIAHYAILRSTTGGAAWRILDHETVLAARESSASYKSGRPDSPWRTHEPAMCDKTIVRRTFPYAVTDSPELAMAFAADDRTITYDRDKDQLMIGDEPLTPESPTVAAQTQPEPEPQREQVTVTRPAKKVPPKKVPESAEEARRERAMRKLHAVHRPHEAAHAAVAVFTGREISTLNDVSTDELEGAANLTPQQVAEAQEDAAMGKDQQ